MSAPQCKCGIAAADCEYHRPDRVAELEAMVLAEMRLHGLVSIGPDMRKVVRVLAKAMADEEAVYRHLVEEICDASARHWRKELARSLK